MKKLTITWKGTNTLIMNSCQGVNPLHPLTIEMKKYTSKKKKTEEDLIAMADLQWRLSLYYRKDVGLHIPGENIEATIKNGAKANRKGTDIEKFVSIPTLFAPFDCGDDRSVDELMKDFEYRDTRPMTVNRAKVMKTRPRFDKWETTFELIYDPAKIDLEIILAAMDYAGKYVGLCDSRPKYGKFVVSSVIDETGTNLVQPADDVELKEAL